MPDQLVIGEFVIEIGPRRLRRRGGDIVHLANRPFQVLAYLVANRGRLVSRAELLEQFWDGRDVYDAALTRCVSTVRKALEDASTPARYVETRWAEGYRFIGPCEECGADDWAGSASPGYRRFATQAEATSAERLVKRGNGYLSRFGLRNQRYALEMFRAALAMDPDDYRAWAGVAASHSLQYLHAERQQHHWHAAIRAADEALERRPISAEAQLARAHVAVMRGDYAEADAAFAFAEDLDKSLFLAWYYHARVCAETRNHDRAVALYERATAADSQDCQATALCQLSLNQLGLRRHARRTALASVEAAALAISRRPDDVRSLSLGACLLPGLGRGDDARRWAERALALEPGEPYVNLNAACTYTTLGEYGRALDLLERVPLSPVGNCKWIRHDPVFDPLREESRFASMMERCGRPPAA